MLNGSAALLDQGQTSWLGLFPGVVSSLACSLLHCGKGCAPLGLQIDNSIRKALMRATLHLVNREYDALAGLAGRLAPVRTLTMLPGAGLPLLCPGPNPGTSTLSSQGVCSPPSAADDFVTLGMLPGDSDKEEIVPALTEVFAEALKGGVSNLSFGDLSMQLGQTM